MKKIIYFITATSLLAVISAGASFVHWWNTPIAIDGDSLVYNVELGASLHRVSQDLSERGIIKWPRVFVAYAQIQNQTNIKVGEYALFPGTRLEQLLEKLNTGDVIHYSVSLIEGKTFKEGLLDLQQQEKLIKSLNSDVAIEQFIASLELPNGHPEGWFFPDTYHYVLGESDRDILIRAHARLKDVLSTEWEGRAADLPYKNSYEALVMASIIEKETGVPSERGEIAGVFVRRLQKNMRLQTDPTVIYGLGDDYNGNIRRKHLSQSTPYNTYVIKGLPPTPIAMAGREAIYAALHPADGEALYFVAKGDGSHYFSATLEEHNTAVQQYQIRKRAKNYQSAPQTKQ